MTGDVVKPLARGLWREAGFRFWKARYLVLALLGVLAVFDVLGPPSGRPTMSMVGPALWAILAIAVHNAVLKDETLWTVPPTVIGPYLWRVALLAIPGLAAGIAVLWLTLHRLEPVRVAALTAAAFGLGSTPALALLGTWLPATIAEGPGADLTAALQRGRKTFSYALWRLVLGGALTLITAFLILSGGRALGQQAGPVITLEPRSGALMIVIHLLFQTALAFTVVMVTVILSRAYLIAEGKASRT